MVSVCLLAIWAMPPRTLAPGSAASVLPAAWGAAFFPLSFSVRCPYPRPLRLLRRSKCRLLAPDWWSGHTLNTTDFQSQCPNMPASSLASNPPAPPGPPPLKSAPPHLQARTSTPAKPAPLGTHPPLCPQPRPLPDTPYPGLPRSFSCLAQKAQQLPSALRPPLPERGLDLSQPAHPALVGRGPGTRRRRGICSCPPPQPRPHGRRGRAGAGRVKGRRVSSAAPRPGCAGWAAPGLRLRAQTLAASVEPRVTPLWQRFHCRGPRPRTTWRWSSSRERPGQTLRRTRWHLAPLNPVAPVRDDWGGGGIVV